MMIFLSSSWSSQLERIDIQPLSSPVGPTVDAIPESPLEIFELFFSSDLLDLIVEESNRYAREAMGDEKYTTWRKVTTDDIQALLGFSILMALSSCHRWMTIGRKIHFSTTRPLPTGFHAIGFVNYHATSILLTMPLSSQGDHQDTIGSEKYAPLSTTFLRSLPRSTTLARTSP